MRSADRIRTEMTNFVKRLRKIWMYGPGRAALAAVCAHSVSISIGISQGYSAILIPQLEKSHEFGVDAEQASWLASLGAITNPIGSILSGLLAEWIGRKRSIQISSLPFLAGWLCIAFAYDIRWLYAGRLITGIAAGMSTACYTYVSEISSPEHRGILQALGPVSASFGILLTYTLGNYISWSLLAFISVAFALFTILAVHYLPESPSHLFKKHQNKEAFSSLLWLRRSNASAQTEYQKYLTSPKIEEEVGWRSLYFRVETMKPFFILVVLFLLQELSGIYSILFYAVNFFEEANIEVDEHISSIIVGVIRFLMSILGAALINKYTRRSLCMFSGGGMAFSLLIIIAYVKYYEFNSDETKVFPLLPLICILFNVLFSMIGMLPLPWILVGELFPLRVRSIMSGVVICIAQCFIFVCVKIYLDMISYLTFCGTLGVFAAAAFLAAVFTKFCMPETKNKSLEEIEELFRKEKEERFGVDNKGFEEEGRHSYTVKVER